MRRIPWIVFSLALLFAIFFFSNTVSSLPPLVASHFDAAGHANAHMTREFYTKFIFAMGIGFPIAGEPPCGMLRQGTHQRSPGG